MDPKLVATQHVALLTRVFIGFDVRIMGERIESVEAACNAKAERTITKDA